MNFQKIMKLLSMTTIIETSKNGEAVIHDSGN